MSDQFCSLVAAHYVGFLRSLLKLHGLAKEIINCAHLYLHIQVNILPSDICSERLKTYKNLCEKENIFRSPYPVLHLLKPKDRAGKTQFHMRYPPGNCSSELQRDQNFCKNCAMANGISMRWACSPASAQ